MPSIGFGFAESRGRGAGSARAFLDPRTKIALLVIMPTVLFSGAGGPLTTPLTLAFAFLAICLLFSCGNAGAAIGGVTAIALTQGAWTLLAPVLPSGLFLPVYIVYGIIVSVVPCFLMAAYAVSTTTVSEFISGMEKLHAPTLITIPLSVMFRFFPTVIEEAGSVNSAMRMRGIRLGGRNIGKMVEYRLVPIMMSSLRIADELSAASLTRGLGAPTKRTSICAIGFRVQDAAVLALCAAAIVLIVVNLTGVGPW